MSLLVNLPDIGDIPDSSGFKLIEQTSDGRFTAGKDGVNAIAATGDEKVEKSNPFPKINGEFLKKETVQDITAPHRVKVKLPAAL